MYEAKQNKEAVSRKIDDGGKASKRMKKEDSEVAKAANTNNKSNHIQRKIGFEFETGWMVKISKKTLVSQGDKDYAYWARSKSPKISKRKKVTLHNPSFVEDYTSLSKKSIIYQGPKFNVEADEAGGGQSEIEFVTSPIEKEDVLKSTMGQMRVYVNTLKDLARRKKYFKLDSFIISPIESDRKANKISAGPQFTVGLPLDALNSILSGSTKSNYHHLNGLIKLINIYIANGEMTLPYPKAITDGALLARTNFVKLFQLAVSKDGLLTEPNIHFWNWFSKKVSLKDWLSFFPDINQPLFKGGIMYEKDNDNASSVADEETLEDTPRLTRREWLTNMYRGTTDNLSSIKDAESLGELGEKTDRTVLGEFPIFEFRNDQATKIPDNKWLDYTLDKFNLYRQYINPTVGM